MENDIKDLGATTVTVENANLDADKKEKTYTRDEINKMINAEKLKIKDEMSKQLENEKSEAERLAKMTAEQKAADKEKKLLEKEAELNYKELTNSAKDILSDKGLSASFAEFIVSKGDTADNVTKKIEDFAKKYNADLDKRVTEKLKGEPPKTGSPVVKQNIARASY